MLKEERHTFILDKISERRKVLSSELSQWLDVSEDTIRRDLKELAEQGSVRKVHGGAMAVAYLPFHFEDREVYARDQKVIIAEKALDLLEDGQVILIDGGTTNLELVKRLPETLEATFFTNSLPIATQLRMHPQIDVFLIGGRLVKDAQITVGLDVVQTLADLRADLFFLGTRSIHHEAGVTEINREEAHVKRAMIAAATRTISMPIAEKLDVIQPFKVENIQKISVIITELSSKNEKLLPYKRMGIEVL